MNRLTAQWIRFRELFGLHRPEGIVSGYERGVLARCRDCGRRIHGDGGGGWLLGDGWMPASVNPIDLDDIEPAINKPARSQP